MRIVSGGILFSLIAGQPLVVIMTTAPIALYIKVNNMADILDDPCCGSGTDFDQILFFGVIRIRILSPQTDPFKSIFALCNIV